MSTKEMIEVWMIALAAGDITTQNRLLRMATFMQSPTYLRAWMQERIEELDAKLLEACTDVVNGKFSDTAMPGVEREKFTARQIAAYRTLLEATK